MNFISSWFKQIIASEQPLSEDFKVVDPRSGNTIAQSITLALTPGDEKFPESVISIFWKDSLQKIYEKRFENDQEAKESFALLKNDLAKVQEFVKNQKLSEASETMENFLSKMEQISDKLVDGDPQPITTTMASSEDSIPEKKSPYPKAGPEYSDFRLWLYQRAENLVGKTLEDVKQEALDAGFRQDIVEQILQEVAKHFNASSHNFLTKEAKIIMQNIFFSTPEEASAYQEKMKALQPEENKLDLDLPPTDDENLDNLGIEEEIGPPSLSYEDAEKEDAEKEKNLTKRIEHEVKEQVQSAMDRKIATMFSDKDENLVRAFRGVGRTWEEIREYMIKNLKYDKDAVLAYLDELKKMEDNPPEFKDVPSKEEPLPESPKPPEDLVSPETHDKLVEEVENASKQSSVQKEAIEPLETPPTLEPDLSESDPTLSDNPLPPLDNNDIIEVELAPGDYVYVMSNFDTGNLGFSGTFVSTFDHKGLSYAVVEEEGGGLHEVPKHLVTRASKKMSKVKRSNLLNKQADPSTMKPDVQVPEEVQTDVKKYKVAPPHTRELQPIPATPEMAEAYKQYQTLEHNMDTIKALLQEVRVKLAAEESRIRQEGGETDITRGMQLFANKLSKMAEAAGAKVIDFGDQLMYFEHTKEKVPYKPTPKELLDRLIEKMPQLQKIIDYITRGLQYLAKQVEKRTITFFPKKKLSKLDKTSSPLEILKELESNFSELLHLLYSI
jgi:hypothetical protein